ncbi:family 16 glycosylhydrolase [Butyrivibrio sp. MC2013]|uniref:family 16 glycosylhydrolase n=1 Tax=Butyrivibrio sp. MC2013 TaxID=1280686 RepID=UPI0006890076|nr:family 16 glycosylhydrolase [Butyrivibrio sp. MC2013]
MKNKTTMKLMLALSTFSIAAAGLLSAATAISAKAADQYELVWSEEFDGNSLNRNNWNVEVNGYGGWNNELQYYVDSPNNIAVSGGTLKITARKENYQGMAYTSARLNTEGKVSLGLGKIEARIKLPSFMGAWPAFWLMGSNGQQWPKCGEIDVLETINDEGIVYGSAHWPSATPGKENDSTSGGTYGHYIDITKWHTYGIERDENQITWYVDDYKYSTMDLKDNALKAPLSIDQYVILNLAIGGDWPGFDIDDSQIPATMEVDYVRAYKRVTSTAPSDPQQPSDPGTQPSQPSDGKKVDLVADNGGTFTGEVGSWAGSKGKIDVKNSAKDGFVADLSAIGSDMWGAQASLADLKYEAGKTYTFRSTLTSNVDKKVFIKVEGDDHAELAADTVSLKAGQQYSYERTVTIPADYRGSLSLYYAFGGGIDGEYNSSSSKLRLEVKNVEFSTGAAADDQTAPEPSVPAWNRKTVYYGGELVTYKGKTYQARWWTQGDRPSDSGYWGPWKLIK